MLRNYDEVSKSPIKGRIKQCRILLNHLLDGMTHMYLEIDDWRDWAPAFMPWLRKRFGSDVLDEFHATVEPSWLEWLDTRQMELSGHYTESVSLFQNVILQEFEGVRVFHATRLRSLEPIRRQGLRAWSAEDLRQQAQAYSASDNQHRLRHVVEQCNPEFRGGRVYSFASLHHALQLEDDQGGRLPDFCTQGGEFLAAVRVGLAGRPTPPTDDARAYLFACELPWTSLEADDLEYVARTVLLDVISSGLLEGNYSMHGERECLTTRQDIVPNWIVEVADVEDLKLRRDLVPADIPWTAFAAE